MPLWCISGRCFRERTLGARIGFCVLALHVMQRTFPVLIASRAGVTLLLWSWETNRLCIITSRETQGVCTESICLFCSGFVYTKPSCVAAYLEFGVWMHPTDVISTNHGMAISLLSLLQESCDQVKAIVNYLKPQVLPLSTHHQ
jgi:hypothetical protein